MPKGIYEHKALSEQTKEKIATKLRIFRLANPDKHPMLGKRRSESYRKLMSQLMRGRYSGRCMSSEIREKIRQSMRGKNKGERSAHWQGGKTEERLAIRQSFEYKQWCRNVLVKDNFICRKCKVDGKYVQPHHIYNFASYPLLRFEVSNGACLCCDHHKEFHRIYGRVNNTQNQFDEYLRLGFN